MSKELNKAPVEQAGGDERSAFEKIHTVPRGIMWNEEKSQYVRVHEKHCSLSTWNSFVALWAGWMYRAALAQPSPAQVECIDCHSSGFCMSISNEEIRCPCGAPIKFSGPAQAEGFTHFPELMESVQQMDAMLKANSAQAERPEVVAWQYRVTAGPQTGWSLWHPGKGEEFERSYTVERRPLMTIAQHERIVKAWIERWKAYIELSAKIAAQRDAADARLHEVATACATAEQERDAALARVAELAQALRHLLHNIKASGKRIDLGLAKECAEDALARIDSATPAQAQHSVPDGYRLIRLEHFAAIKAQLNPEQVDAYRGRNIYDEDKVYANWNAYRSALDEIKDVFQQIDWDAENELAELLAAAPGKEVGHE
ncbi:hypothetical protein ACEP3J_11880 [Pseudomonas aeruginosa]